MRRGHPQQGVPSVATLQQRLPPLLVELAARARACGWRLRRWLVSEN